MTDVARGANGVGDVLQQHGLVSAARGRCGAPREVPPEQCRHATIPAIEPSRSARRGNAAPSAGTPPPTQAARCRAATPRSADDLDTRFGHEHVDQDTVVVRRIPHAELSEQLQRALPRRQIAP